ncbi:MAG: hypothetical protein Q4A52_07930, partial [Bacillota bacterium]|nr:hypothetical protein [Bacillota bacterium]
LDTGDMLLKREISIREMPIQAVHDLFAREGAELLLETISSLDAGTVDPVPQDHTRSSYAKKITKADFEFRPSDTVSKSLARLRAFGYLKLRFHDKQFKLFQARRYPDGEPFDPTRCIRLECSDGWLELLEIQPENAKRMSTQAYLIGHRSDAVLS